MKKYNKYLYVLLSAMILIGCSDPLEDEIKKIEDEQNTPLKTFNYRLTSDDYGTLADNIRAGKTAIDSTNADFVENNEAFSNSVQAADYIPSFFNDLYPYFRQQSAIILEYNKYEGDSEVNALYLAAKSYYVNSDDYASVTPEAEFDGFFNDTFKADDYLAGILDANVSSPQNGDLIAANYEYATFEYDEVSYRKFFTEDFESYDVDNDVIAEKYQVSDTEGDQEWFFYSSSSGYQAARMGGFSGGMNNANMDRLILPQIDLTGFTAAKLKLNHVVNFLGTGVYDTDLAVMVSTDYDGINPTTATWTTVPLNQWPVGDTYDRMDSEADLSAYANQQIYVSFYYKSTVDYAPQWRLIDILVVDGQPYATEKVNVFYEYSSGAWAKVNNDVYLLSPADYVAMGDPGPGKFGNFSFSVRPSDYLPKLLLSLNQFAQEKDKQNVAYKFYNGSKTVFQLETYTLLNGVWIGMLLEQANEQYIYNGTEWLFDPSIILTMNNANFQTIVDVVAASSDSDLVNSFGSGEDLYGADAFFGNFDIRSGSKGGQSMYEGLSANDAEALAIVQAGKGMKIFLEADYPTQETKVNGVDVFYVVTAKTYNGEDGFIVATFQVTAIGEFTLIEGPSVVE